MKTLGLYKEPAGATVRLKLTPDDKVVTYAVFLDRWTDTGSQPEQTFHPQELEQGVSFQLGNAKGYDVILKAQINGDSVMKTDLMFGTAPFTDDVLLPVSEGPVVVREWSIIIVK